MNTEDAKRLSLRLIEDSKVAMVGVNGQDGYPLIKAMFKLEHDGLRTFYFSTNTSSKRVQLLKQDPRASLYFADTNECEGVMLVGNMEVLHDPGVKERFWWDGCEQYYPLGVNDPDYSVLRFTSSWGRYYHNLATVSFDVEKAQV